MQSFTSIASLWSHVEKDLREIYHGRLHSLGYKGQYPTTVQGLRQALRARLEGVNPEQTEGMQLRIEIYLGQFMKDRKRISESSAPFQILSNSYMHTQNLVFEPELNEQLISAISQTFINQFRPAPNVLSKNEFMECYHTQDARVTVVNTYTEKCMRHVQPTVLTSYDIHCPFLPHDLRMVIYTERFLPKPEMQTTSQIVKAMKNKTITPPSTKTSIYAAKTFGVREFHLPQTPQLAHKFYTVVQYSDLRNMSEIAKMHEVRIEATQLGDGDEENPEERELLLHAVEFLEMLKNPVISMW